VNKRLSITPGRLAVLVVGTPLALLVIAVLAIIDVAHVGRGTYHVQLSVPVRGHSVEMSLDSGDLHVRQVTTAKLQISGTALYSLVRSTVTPYTTGSGVKVTSNCHFVTLQCSFDYVVGMPAGTAETFSDGQGHITVTGITNPIVTASDGAGSVTLTFTKVPSRVDVTAAFGNVKIVLPPGLTVYNVVAHDQLGTSLIEVPISAESKHLINVNDGSGSILVIN
jgi:hypothetical protein